MSGLFNLHSTVASQGATDYIYVIPYKPNTLVSAKITAPFWSGSNSLLEKEQIKILKINAFIPRW
jgi:hypothetical protein